MGPGAPSPGGLGAAPASLPPAVPPAPSLLACCFPRLSRLRAARAPQDLGRRLPPQALRAVELSAQTSLPGGPGCLGTPPRTLARSLTPSRPVPAAPHLPRPQSCPGEASAPLERPPSSKQFALTAVHSRGGCLPCLALFAVELLTVSTIQLNPRAESAQVGSLESNPGILPS